jgi:hypothetical protein
MVRILGWEIRRIIPDRKCCACNAREWGLIPARLREYRGKDVCYMCWGWKVFDQLDAELWSRRPDLVPPCRHCGQAVPPEQLERKVIQDMYFCLECAADSEVIRYWERSNEEWSR